MKVFKFGGASIKSAIAIKNVAKILNSQDLSNCLLVISAMGKMTNAFEKITDAYFNNDQEKLTESIDFTSNFHLKIINNLFVENHVIHQKTTVLFEQLTGFLTQNKSRNYDYLYDQIVSYGELLSTTIVSDYLNEIKIYNNLKKFYKKSIFIKFAKFNTPISTNDVINSNNCFISVCKTKLNNRIVIISAIDNSINRSIRGLS